MFAPEEFLNTDRGRRYIHIHTEQELAEILDYYKQNHQIKSHSVNNYNWEEYPYLYYGSGSINGNRYGALNKEDRIEFEEWAAMAIPQDFKESDKPLSFLFD